MAVSPDIDHIFRQYDIRGVVGQQLDSDLVYRLGRSLATYYEQHGVSKVSVGRDARLSSQNFVTLWWKDSLKAAAM